MKFFKKLFFDINMTWPKVIVIAIICGLGIGGIMLPECLADTSFQQPGISYEFWILAALVIILNCEKPVEAGLKTFVFFLISQPLIYLVQVPFNVDGFGIFKYYPFWFVLTILTLPGGMIAWYVKKEKLYSVLILGVADCILCFTLSYFCYSLLNYFPKMLIAVLFIIIELVGFTLIFFKDHKLRLASFALIACLLAGSFYHEYQITYGRHHTFEFALEGEAPFEIVEGLGPDEMIIEDDHLVVKCEFYMSTPLRIKDNNGNVVDYFFYYNDQGAQLNKE